MSEQIICSMSPPCKGCTKRYTACHDKCGPYLTWKQARDAGRKYYQVTHTWTQKRNATQNEWMKSQTDYWRKV